MSLIILQSAVVTSATGAVTFSNIPSGYQNLQIKAYSRGDYNPGANTTGTLYMRFNGDSTTTNYYNTYFRSDGYSISNGNSQATGLATMTSTLPLSQALASTFGFNMIDIMDYASTTKSKTWKAIGGVNQNVAATNANFSAVNSGIWVPTSAITSITLLTDGNHVAGSRFDLYGYAQTAVTGV